MCRDEKKFDLLRTLHDYNNHCINIHFFWTGPSTWHSSLQKKSCKCCLHYFEKSMCKYCFLKISCGIIELFHLDFDRNPHVELRCKRTSRPSSSTPRTAPTASTGRRTSTSSARSWTSRTRSRPSSRTTRRSRGSSAARSGWAADKVFRFFFFFFFLGGAKVMVFATSGVKN